MTNLDILSYAENGIALRIRELDKFKTSSPSIAATITRLEADKKIIQAKIADLLANTDKVRTVFEEPENG
jgi:hypothetical protein